MRRTASIHTLVIFTGVFILFGGLILLMKSSLLNTGNGHLLSFGISADLIIMIPGLYFLAIRKTKIPNGTVIPVMVIGLILGLAFLPLQHQSYLQLFKNYALPILELSILTFVIFKIRRIRQAYNQIRNASGYTKERTDFHSTLLQSLEGVLPRPIAILLVSEISVLYYGFINWTSVKQHKKQFSYHKESGTLALFGAIILIMLVECCALHFLLNKWNPIVAWIISGLSIYTCLQIFGIARSMPKRLTEITDQHLILRYGIFSESIIPLSTIKSIEISGRDLDKENKKECTLSPLGGLDAHNMIIHLHSEGIIKGLYGMTKPFTTIAFHIDKKDELKDTLTDLTSLTVIDSN